LRASLIRSGVIIHLYKNVVTASTGMNKPIEASLL
jgi:hypothetical protein